jgi:hypothetical protein
LKDESLYYFQKKLTLEKKPKNNKIKHFLLSGFFNANPDARHNVYFSKQYAYDPPQAVVRACLTVIDHNRNADRKPRKDRDGDDKVVTVTTRDGQDSKERTIMEEKNTTWRQEILAEVLQVGKM